MARFKRAKKYSLAGLEIGLRAPTMPGFSVNSAPQVLMSDLQRGSKLNFFRRSGDLSLQILSK
jgi:hypothetical protein